MFIFRTSLLTAVCLADLLGAATVDHPIYFEQRSSALFEARSAGQLITIRPDRLELDGVTLRFVRPSKNARLAGIGTPAPSTYITRGQTRSFPQFPKARIRRLYPGIDAAFYGYPGHLEYDLDLAPGASPDRIRIGVSGARDMRLDEQGNLVVKTRSGEFRQLVPRVFQNGREVPAHYVQLSADVFGFRLGKHDRAMPVTIDPVIVYTKYFGGSASDSGGPVATDAQGNVYVTGTTNSLDFPFTNGTKSRVQPPLFAYSNAGKTVTGLPVGTETSVTVIAGTSDGSVLYVATPDGIFISGNHGASFFQAVPLMPAGIVQAISVDQADPSRAWIATSAGLFVMNSAGQFAGENDFGMAVGGAGHVNAASVEISPTNHAVIYATTAYPNYLYTSTDAGSTWQQLYPSYPGEPEPLFPVNTITFTLAPNGTDLYVIDGNGILFKSSDGGMTWQQLSGQYFLQAKSITFDPKNPSNIYIVDNGGLELSTNGGQNFTTISPALAPGQYVQAFAMDGTGALYLATYTQIEVSVDHGKTWKALPQGPDPQVLLGLGGQVFVGVQSTGIPFVAKWNPDGSQLLYSTFFGGSGGPYYADSIAAITVDAQGEAIIAGNAISPDFPVTETISPASPGQGSGFVAKLSADGSQVIYSSIIGASQGVGILGLAVDSSGASYITGTTRSPDFPTTSNSFQPKLPTSMCQRPNTGPLGENGNLGTNAFVSKLNPNGSSLVYSTFLTGACGSIGQGIALDAAGEAVVAGSTNSPDFPVSANAYQSTFPGGDTADVNYPDPIDFGFVTKLSAAGDKMIAGSFIGGGFMTEANALALDSSGDAYITGSTSGITPGATPGAYQTQLNQTCMVSNIGPAPPSVPSDAFLLKLDPAFTSAQYLTYLGAGCDTAGNSIVLAPSGNVWIAGYPTFQDFPMAAPYELAGTGSYFVSEFNADASQLLFSSFSDGQYLAQDPTGAIYVAGSGQPISSAKSSNYVSLVKIDPTGTPSVIINSIGVSSVNQTVSNPVNPYPNAVAPGELIAIAGQNLGPSATVMAQLDQTGQLPYQVSGTSVSFNGYSAPLISVQDSLIVCFAPFEISGPTDVTVTVDSQKSTPVRVAAQSTAPYILSIFNQDGTVNSANHPAPQGSVVTVYMTGLGLTSPLSQDGSVAAPPLPVPVMPVSAAINANQAPVEFVGAADGLVAGITQVNVQIPTATYPSNPIYASVNAAQAQIYIGQ